MFRLTFCAALLASTLFSNSQAAENLAAGKPTTASSSQNGHPSEHAVDGTPETRWCANGSQKNEWWQVDLGESKSVKVVRIQWESDNAIYRYEVDASADGQEWKTIVDESKNETIRGIREHQVKAPDTRYLRVTFRGSNTGNWGSFWDFAASDGKLPKLQGTNVKGSGKLVKSPAAGDVSVPAGFNVTMFAAPPEVNYPVTLAASLDGQLFVGVDEQGSLGKEKGRGRVARCVDTDGDGQADQINTFAKMDHPRGVFYDNHTLWVLHPPDLTVFYDDDQDGTADRQETLATGLSTDQVARRGADHTTNGIRLGIDGWIYIAVGDFGVAAARGSDDTVISRRGGGVIRIRPDGSEMEVFAWGLRNIVDVCVDPYVNVFTRDNTNDGGGWDIRLSHIMQSAEYGYPSWYKNFSEEIMPPLADYGGGSGCGGLYFHDARWPEKFANTLFTCDWGRSEIYAHHLPVAGPTFAAHQETFAKLPRPTDVDVDGSGRMYLASWKGGKFNYGGPDVGFVAQVVPEGYKPQSAPDLAKADGKKLMNLLASPSAVIRQHTQLEILRRGRDAATTADLANLAGDPKAPLYGRVAAIFTLKQLDGVDSHGALLELTKQADVREFALKALTDRKSQLEGLPLVAFTSALKDDNPRVRAQAIICLGRLGKVEVAEHLLPLTMRAKDSPLPDGKDLWRQPDEARVIPHLAVRALVGLNAVDACLAALDGPHRPGALATLKYLHQPKAVDGLIAKLNRTRDAEERGQLLAVLIRLYHREGDGTYTGQWWGTRPDHSGPYYDRKTWEESERIARVITAAVNDADETTGQFLRDQLALHKVSIKGLPSVEEVASQPQVAIQIPAFDKNDKSLIGNMSPGEVATKALAAQGDVQAGKKLFTQQSCIACHTTADGQTPKGPHLVDIGKRSKPSELIESLVQPSAKIAQGFDTLQIITVKGKIYTGFVVSQSAEAIELRQGNGIQVRIPRDDIDEEIKMKKSAMPEGVVGNLKPAQLADLLAFLQSLN